MPKVKTQSSDHTETHGRSLAVHCVPALLRKSRQVGEGITVRVSKSPMTVAGVSQVSAAGAGGCFGE